MDADAILDRRRLKRRLTVWRVVAVVALLAVIALVAREMLPLKDAHVARLTIEGFISEDFERQQAIEALAEEDLARAVIVKINSPGGTTTGSEEIYHALRKVAEKKPVVAVIGTLGTSGGYIVAIGADHIVARETSITGSIGVLFQTAQITGLLEKLGIEAESLKSSPLKGQPSPIDPMTDQVRSALRDLIEDSYTWFSQLVTSRRNLNDNEATIVTDGRVFTGRQAIEIKLIDAIGGEDAARAWLQNTHQIDKSLPAVDVTWGQERDYLDLTVSALAGKLFENERLRLDGLMSVWQPR